MIDYTILTADFDYKNHIIEKTNILIVISILGLIFTIVVPIIIYHQIYKKKGVNNGGLDEKITKKKLE